MGAALAILMEEPEVLHDYGVVPHLLTTLSDEALPIETKGVGPNAAVDVKSRLQDSAFGSYADRLAGTSRCATNMV